MKTKFRIMTEKEFEKYKNESVSYYDYCNRNSVEKRKGTIIDVIKIDLNENKHAKKHKFYFEDNEYYYYKEEIDFLFKIKILLDKYL